MFQDLDTFTTEPKAKPVAQKFICDKCGGTGVYRGIRVHQTKTKCFACNGKGYFMTSKQDRAKASVQRAKRKADKLIAARTATKAKMEAQRPGIILWIAQNADWNDFAASIVRQIGERGTLTDNQINAICKMADKTEATRAKRAAEKAQAAADAPNVGALTRVVELFNNAKDSGIKRPKLRVGKLTLNPAPMSGKNAGFIYAKRDGEYMGKISPDGKFYGREIADELREIAKDPMASAKAYGQRTGQCSCCGRELTNSVSIEMGIGPICAEKWGL